MLPLKIKILLILSLCFIPLFCYANKANNKKQELNQVTEAIKNLQKNLSATVNKQTSLQQQLKENEEARGDLAVERKKTEKKLAQQQRLLKKLHLKKQKYQQQLNEQKNDLLQQIRSTYMLEHQSYFKILLNQEDPSKMNRVFVYYNYLQNFRLQLITKLNQTLKNLKKTEIAIKKQTKKLSLIKQRQIKEDNKLKVLQNNRSSLLKNTNLAIKSQKQKLNDLLAQKKELEKIIAQLKSSSTATKFAPTPAPWGKSTWPTQGKVHNLFGHSIANSQLKWDGVLIDAPEGQKVYAIASGKVIFSQWLQGYGLLLIIDHGRGYMSLYGRNNSLYKKVGDTVTKGDLITEVGNSGGYDQTSLYFAIRYNGKPVDPKIWCKS